jgi:hypothetical protein
MTRSAILGAAAILASALASPAMAQEVIYNPGYCAQFYPNANCQNKGPGNPYTDSYQRQVSRNQVYRDRTWRDSYTAGTTTAASGRAMSRPASSAARPARRLASRPLRSAAMPMPTATALSASPAPGSAARMAGGISASKASRICDGKPAKCPAFSCRDGYRGSGPLRPSLVFEPPKIGANAGCSHRSPITQFAGLAQR